MIYDCFTFFNELDLLDIRLNILNDYVDKFVIVESTKTFTGKDKPLYFAENKERFKEFESKIIHIVVNEFPETDNPWVIESIQRNSIEKGLVNCKDDDTILISDLDEIPIPEYINKYKDIEGIKLFEQRFSNYYINCLQADIKIWLLGTKMLSYYDFKHFFDDKTPTFNEAVVEEVNQGTTATLIRDYKKCYHIQNGGWHFRNVGSAEKIREKLKSFSHTEYADESHCSIKVLDKKIKKHKGFIILPITDNYFPKYIQENTEKFAKYIHPITLKEKIQYFLTQIRQHFFAIYNEYSGQQKRKVVNILGLKIKFKKKQH